MEHLLPTRHHTTSLHRPYVLWLDDDFDEASRSQSTLEAAPCRSHLPRPTPSSFIYLSAGSPGVPIRCPQRSPGPARESSLFPARRGLPHSYRTSGSPHPSGWTHWQPTSPSPERGSLSTAGGLWGDIRWCPRRSGSQLFPEPQTLHGRTLPSLRTFSDSRNEEGLMEYLPQPSSPHPGQPHLLPPTS